MAKFRFKLIETFTKEYEVDADTRDEAYNKLDQMVCECKADATIHPDDYQCEIRNA